ncbi:MAG: hypothetical protein ABIT36_08775, partial [Steroidobacteraceae bacterium]
MTLKRPLYESLPLLYGAGGLAGLVVGYLLRSHTLASLLLSVTGLGGLLAGLVIWLRRRDYRRLSEQYRTRELDDELGD